MDALTAFGLFAVTAMLVCYALEDRSHWFVLAFARSCALGSAYGFLQGAWPFGVVETIWAVVDLASRDLDRVTCRQEARTPAIGTCPFRRMTALRQDRPFAKRMFRTFSI